MEGTRRSVTSADGIRLGLLTAGTGPALLLVHGGMGSIELWQPVWEELTGHRRVTAMDRRGRCTSGDAGPYSLHKECADVAAVASALAADQGSPIDVLGHSFGAICVLGAAGRGAPFRRIVLHEPPGPRTVSGDWLDRMSAMIEAGEVGRATVSFLTEIIGLTHEQVRALRDAQGGHDVLPIVAATLPREGRAVASVDLPAAARLVGQPVLLLLGTQSPPWAGQITRELAAAMPQARIAELAGTGHGAIAAAPQLFVHELLRFLD